MTIKKQRKISVITPSFNQADFLRQTIESVINQEGDFKIEYIVMDGGSTDHSVKVLQEYETKLKQSNLVDFIWHSEKDHGQSDAINKGMRIASGDIIAYINSDDTYCAGAFDQVVKAFSDHPKSLWATGYCHIIDENGRLISNLVTRYKNFWLKRYSYVTLQVLNYVCQPATFWRREALDQFGFFDESLHYTMDYDYWLKIGKVNRPVIIKQFLANFRIHSASKGKTAYIKQFDQDYLSVKKYSSNSFLIFLHFVHNGLIKLAYRMTK
ncbi:MAG: glycosyltransferase family 2 protein [Patescibacteria group bacterium]|jgi:glycosyltransferase involved in cell wall biosynthesis